MFRPFIFINILLNHINTAYNSIFLNFYYKKLSHGSYLLSVLLVLYLKVELLNHMDDLTWMDAETKKKAEEKVKSKAELTTKEKSIRNDELL